MLGSSPNFAGLYLGLAAHDTSQVIGSALTYESVYGRDTVLKSAIITKLTRNLCLAGVIPIMAVRYCGQADNTPLLHRIKNHTPAFVYGFLLMSIMRTGGDLCFSEDSICLPDALNELWKSYINAAGFNWSHLHKGLAQLGVVGLGFSMVLIIFNTLQLFLLGEHWIKYTFGFFQRSGHQTICGWFHGVPCGIRDWLVWSFYFESIVFRLTVCL